ncbi:MAG: CoA transferase [Proteobacteria bacterium]|nr:CoA transferase [Pseudomonadota bacterium]
MTTSPQDHPGALDGVRVLSLALNMPGPAALMRCRQMGAHCTKLEAPPPPNAKSSDPMGAYNPPAYAQLHEGVNIALADLKSAEGQATLQALLAQTDVLITSFRPSASARLGVDWASLQPRYPRLSLVEIVGAPGERAGEPGHDLTYLAEAGLVPGLALPPTLYADMAGSLMASEAVLQALLRRAASGRGSRFEVALSVAAQYVALPHGWGLTQPNGTVGGAHAGYRVYACADGRVAVAALEPHFAQRLCQAVGVPGADSPQAALALMFRSATHHAVAEYFGRHTREQLERLAGAQDIPLHTLPPKEGSE